MLSLGVKVQLYTREMKCKHSSTIIKEDTNHSAKRHLQLQRSREPAASATLSTLLGPRQTEDLRNYETFLQTALVIARQSGRHVFGLAVFGLHFALQSRPAKGVQLR